ncbi:MAG: cation transporter [Pyrodictiaceae archaeon]
MSAEAHGKLLAMVIVLVVLGGAVKIAGFILSGSRALYVDGLTCIASILAVVFFYRFVGEAFKPADRDHPYGHGRMLIASSMLTIVIYSFVGGVAFASIASWGPVISLEPTGVLYAAIGLVVYSFAVLLARRIEVAGRTLSYFTGLEILESSVSLASVTAGVYASPFYDYVGSIILLGFLVYGLVVETREIIPLISDYVPPGILDEVRREIEEEGLKVVSLRLRPCPGKGFLGDAVVRTPSYMSVDEAHKLIDLIENKVRKKYNASIVIHVEPEKN